MQATLTPQATLQHVWNPDDWRLEQRNQEVVEIMVAAYQKGWISTRDGNASVKLDGKGARFFATPSGVRKQRLASDDMIELGWSPDGEGLTQLSHVGGLRPTGEIELHARLMRGCGSARAVLHLHPTYTIAALFRGMNLQALAQDFPEINRYTRVGPSVGMIPPVSSELADATCLHLGLGRDGEVAYDIVALDRHGVVAVAEDPWVAFEHVERLEHICQIALAAGRPGD